MEDEYERLLLQMMNERDLQLVKVCWLVDEVVVIVVCCDIFDVCDKVVEDVSA